MATPPEKEDGLLHRRLLIEAGLGVVMLVLAFAAIASSDVSATRTQVFWTALVVIFGIAAYVADYSTGMTGKARIRGIVITALHWVGVFLSIGLINYFAAAGRIDNAEIGLTCGVLLALGSFLAGVHGNWRLLILGAGVGCAAAGVAFVEEYIWFMFGIVVLALVALVIGARLARREKSDPIADV